MTIKLKPEMGELYEKLFDAVGKSDLAGVMAAVEAGADVNAYSGWALYNTIKSDSPHMLAIVKYLVENGADVNERYGWIVVEAVGSSRPDAFALVKYIMEHSPKRSLPDDRQRANIEENKRHTMEHAAGNTGPDALAIVEYLVESCDMASWWTNCKGRYGDTALEYAVGNMNPDAFAIVRCLVEHGRKNPDGSWEHVDINSCDGSKYSVLHHAVTSANPDAVVMVKYLVERGANVAAYDGMALRSAIRSSGTNAFAIFRYLVEHGKKCCDTSKIRVSLSSGEVWENVDVHLHLCYEEAMLTMLEMALVHGKSDIADYLLSRNDFLLSDLMPRNEKLEQTKYDAFRKKMILYVSDAIERKGHLYAQIIAADIEKILKSNYPEPTREDIEALEPLVKKISSTDWVADAQVASGDFLFDELANFPSDKYDGEMSR